jgi:integrase/recombinase XerD
VLETPPKFGREDPRIRNRIKSLTQDELRKRKKTFNALVSVLRGAFEIAYECGHLEPDRSIRSLRRLPNVDRPRIVFLDRSECRALLKVSNPDLRQLILAAMYTGCRASELIAMQVGDFALHTRSIYVASPKGRKTRHVLLPPEAVAFFKKLAFGRVTGDRLFRKANGRIWGGEYKSYFQKARTAAGLTATITLNGLRHTYASQLLQNSASIITVADQLGHANTQTVSATYGHLTSKS